MKRTVLIADDEPNARDYLNHLLKGYEDIEVLGCMKNGQEVIDFCRTLQPEILLLDIEMPGIDGLTAAKKLSGKLGNTVLIFITAYDQYAIQAFEHAAIGYLLKPFDEKELRRILDRAKSQLLTMDKAKFSEQMHALWDAMDKPSKTSLEAFEIKDKGLIHSIPVETVLYIQSESEYVRLVTPRQTYLQRLSIKTLENQLPPYFHRVHRSFLINENHIASWKYQNGHFEFKMQGGDFITSSRSYKNHINSWLN